MTLSMARCIGRPGGCDGRPSSRGLCRACYQRHALNGNLAAFPTMSERTSKLKSRGYVPVQRVSNSQRQREMRVRNKAERILIDGYLIHPRDGHGVLHMYTAYSCRGPMCRAVQRWYRDTGEGSLPAARTRDHTAQECAAYPEWGNYK